MDLLDEFEATALDDPLADLDRLLALLGERYGVTDAAAAGEVPATPATVSVRGAGLPDQ